MACSEKDSLFVSLSSIFHNFWDIIYDWNIINILGESRAFSLWNFFFLLAPGAFFFLGRVTWYQDFFFAVGASSFPTRTKRLLKVVSLYAIQKVHHTEKKRWMCWWWSSSHFIWLSARLQAKNSEGFFFLDLFFAVLLRGQKYTLVFNVLCVFVAHKKHWFFGY